SSGGWRRREAAAGRADRSACPARSGSVDGRLTLAFASGGGLGPALRAVVLPRPSRDCPSLSIRRLSPSRALFALNGCPRISGWQHSPTLRAIFQTCESLVRLVPVFEVVVPWGPPFPASLVEELVEGVGLH